VRENRRQEEKNYFPTLSFPHDAILLMIQGSINFDAEVRGMYELKKL